jgi:hypothetical protein
MKKWISLFIFFVFLQASAQYSYTYTDPCTLQLKSVFVPAGGGVVVNYFDNHNTFSANDFSSGIFDAWISQVSQQNSSAPCSQVTTTLTNNVTSIVVSNTVGIVTNVVAISSLAQSMASISSSIGSSMSSTAGGISNTGIGNAVDNNQSNSNGKSNNTGSTGGNQTNNQNQGGTTPSTTTGGNSSSSGGTGTGQGGSTPSTNQPAQGGEQTSQSSIDGGSSSGASGNTANSISNSIDGGGSEGGSSSGGSTSSSKKQAAAKTSSGSLIASGDMVAISSTDGETANQYKVVASITHANTRGTRIKGVLFNYTTGANNMNVTLYKSWINKSRSLNTIAANSTMMDFEKNIFNTTTGLESYKINKSITAMFGMNFTLGKMGERNFYNLSAVGGGHVSTKVTDRVSTSVLVLAIYSPFTQFYDGKWFGAGILFVPFNSWDFKITKTFKYNISFTGVYEMNKTFLNYQILTGGKISF